MTSTEKAQTVMKYKLINIAAYIGVPVLTALIIGALAFNATSPIEKTEPEANTYTKDSLIIRTPVGHLHKGRYTYAIFPGEIYINGHHHPMLKEGDTIGIRLETNTYIELTPDTPTVTKYVTNTGEEIEP